MYEIIPSPGTQDKEWSAIEKKIELVRSFSRTIHIDVIDGKFADNTTFSNAASFGEYSKNLKAGGTDPFTGESEFKFEVHLMVDNPIEHVKRWADAGFERFIGQIEKMPDQAAFVAEAQLWGEVGLALDKDTPLDALKVHPDDLDVILVMTIKAGFSGQKLEEELLEKVKQIREENEYMPIEVDGGINDETIEVAAAAGATRFVTTSFLYELGTPKEQHDLLMKKLEELKPLEK